MHARVAQNSPISQGKIIIISPHRTIERVMPFAGKQA